MTIYKPRTILRPVVYLLLLFPASVLAGNYKVVTEDTLVMIHVGTAGMMQAMGHEHLITSRQLTGELKYSANDLQFAQLHLSLPVNSFVVDDPQQRKEFGEPYEDEVDDSAREGTRENMLGEDLLDAKHHKKITITGQWHSGSLANGKVQLNIEVRGNQYRKIVPVKIQETASRLLATGSFSVQHGDLGLTPFSVMGGMLAVADTIDIDFRISLSPVTSDKN